MEDCARRFVLLKLTTGRHEATVSLFATAELLVYNSFPVHCLVSFLVSFVDDSALQCDTVSASFPALPCARSTVASTTQLLPSVLCQHLT